MSDIDIWSLICPCDSRIGVGIRPYANTTVQTVLWQTTVQTVLWQTTVQTVLWQTTVQTVLWQTTVQTVLWQTTMQLYHVDVDLNVIKLVYVTVDQRARNSC